MPLGTKQTRYDHLADRNPRRAHLWMTVVMAGLIIAMVGCPARFALGQDAQLNLKEEVGIDQRLNEDIPLDLAFQDEFGRRVKLGRYFGERPVILMMVYYECPMLCGLELNALVRTLRALEFDVGDEFSVVTVSIDPGESPGLAAEKKRSYLDAYGRDGAADGWHFLTGEEESIRRLAEAVGFRYKYIPRKDQYAHAAGLMVLTPDGTLSRYFYGVNHKARDIRLGLVEASKEEIGSPADQVLLFCYQYNPSTGKYTLMITNVLRIAGLLTVLTLGTLIALLFRWERRGRAVREQEEHARDERTQPRGTNHG